MDIKWISLPSHWGRDARHKYYDQGSDTLAVIFPGKNYPAEQPLLYYAVRSALGQGFNVLELEYGYRSARKELKKEELDVLARECGEAIGLFPEAARLVYIGKSIGTVVAGQLAARETRPVDCLYLTPLPETVPFITETGGMVIYGSADPLFPPRLAEDLSGHPHVALYRMDDANHSLETGDTGECLAILMVVNRLYGEYFGAVRLEAEATRNAYEDEEGEGAAR
ncbi:hypothetical protein F4V43_18055 [Paenibacillus spiritus]|uniref:Alpha/beta hydrolase n=1 Tax=Paenibacillus spiritus TaxID=2496557 RepID=A0A5J5FU66_9BACL|nr:hypothetical protein [Paenibacillus spiritus]KAA8997196.1 hypothetical protein F4V43_18055 [Paenibacillus spiritus]